jgi:acetyltransferase-like isoleucine patch superfamily enzyme
MRAITATTPSVVKRAARALGVTEPLRRLKGGLGPLVLGLELQVAFVVSHLPARRLRHAVFARMGLTLGPGALIHRGVEVRNPRRVTIGEGSVIGFDAILDGRHGIEIGRRVNVSSQAAIWTMQHDFRRADFAAVGASVRIEDFVWLSFRSVILPGVTVGRGAIVAAGAVVTRDVPPMAIVAGVPARVVGERPDVGLDYSLSDAAVPWFI